MKLNKLSILILVILCTQGSSFGQTSNSYNYQLEISTDNDAFIIWENYDRYYTYGAGFKLNFKVKKLLGLENVFQNKFDYFFSVGIRSEGYTPTRENFTEEEFSGEGFNFERPFAGLLYGTFSINYLFKNAFVKTELYLGIMGPSAYSREIQNWIHENITDDDLINGWEFQIPDQPVINMNISAAQVVYTNDSWFEAYIEGQARIGNLYIDATPLIGFRLGKFASINESNAFGNGIVAPLKVKEFFLKSSFSVTATLYDGTAQGNICNNDYVYQIEDLSHFHSSMSHGLFYSGNKFSASFDHIFTFGKVNQRVRHIYGRFVFNYRF